jgi:UDP-N-acetylglucosamine 2-epimerase (non-hydrolysing)
MIKVLSVLGTRPEAIKMAPVVRELEGRSGEFESLICLSAQHREMLDRALAAFGLSAGHDFNLMTPDQTPAHVAARVLQKLPPLLEELEPDVLLVQGDTMTTFAAALAAHLARIPVGHVEAGLRTGERYQPFPEEMNRVLTTRLTTLHFAPTERARAALLTEGIAPSDIFLTGNTVIDALLQILKPEYRFENPELRMLDPSRRMVLLTAHRRENFGRPLRSICAGVADLAGRFPDVDFVLPVHPNPEVKRTVRSLLEGRSNIRLVDPVEYEEFAHLMSRAHIILTDSGGIQEEAPSLGKPVLVLREVTERPEGVEAGTAVVVGTDSARIVEETVELLTVRSRYEKMANAVSPYGDGRASSRIVDALAARLR